MKYFKLLFSISLLVYSCSPKQDSFQIEELNNILIKKTKEIDRKLHYSYVFVRDNGNRPRDTMIYHESFMFYRTIMDKLSKESLHESGGLVQTYLTNKKINASNLIKRINHFDSIILKKQNSIDSQFLKIAILDGLSELIENNMYEFGTSCNMFPDHAIIIYKHNRYSKGDTVKVCIVPGDYCTDKIAIFKPIEIELTNTNSGKKEKFQIEYAGNAAFVKFTSTESGSFRLNGSVKYSFRHHGTYVVENRFNELIQFVK